MALEIERKYLVTDDSYKSMATLRKHIWQGYISTTVLATIRTRIIEVFEPEHKSIGYVTLKSKKKGFTRSEWEYEIPVEDAREMGKIAMGIIDKTRYIVPYEGYVWEIDEFEGRHAGLVVAEVEIPSEDVNPPLPPFIGEEVTGNPIYFNSYLSTLK